MSAGLDPERLRAGHGAKWTAVDPDVLPAWVADMDLGIPGPVRASLLATIEREDLGYPAWPDGDPVVAAFEEHERERYGWSPREGRTRVLSDLIQVLQVVIETTTRPGEAIALHVPSYPPFLASIARAGRRIVPLPIPSAGDDQHLDLEAHRRAFERHRPRLLILVDPHNPTGRVLRRTELEGLAALAAEHDVPVLADEIHADLTYAPHRHVPFASLGPEVADRAITATSATKSHNLAGTRCAVVHVGHTPTAEALDRAPLDYFGTPSVLSRVATVAAWRHSDAWLRSTLDLLTANRARVDAWVAGRPELAAVRPEATYLSWIDFSRTALAHDPAGEVLRRGRVQLSPGADFGQHTDVDTSEHARLNFATRPATLEQILERIDDSLDAGHDRPRRTVIP